MGFFTLNSGLVGGLNTTCVVPEVVISLSQRNTRKTLSEYCGLLKKVQNHSALLVILRPSFPPSSPNQINICQICKFSISLKSQRFLTPGVTIFCTQKLAFFQKCPSLHAQKWHFECLNENSETTFMSPPSPQIDGIAFGFKRLPLLDGF